jgi:hypothetical protein
VRLAHVNERKADRAVRLVDVADGSDPPIRLGDAGAVDETGVALVAGARVDFGELYQLTIPSRARP